MQLYRVCQYLKSLLDEEWKLWIHIHARDPPYTREMLEYITEKANEKTKSISITGDNNRELALSANFIQHISVAINLTVLVLEKQIFNTEVITVNSFPSTLEELSLKGTYVENYVNFFKQSFETMSNLKVLILDECTWVQTNNLMSLSRYKKLEILSLVNCTGLDDSISYLSLAGSMGFKTIKVIDVRFTALGNALLKSLYRSQTVLAIYLQNDTVSSKTDYLKHHLQTLNGSKSQDIDLDDFSIEDYFSIRDNRRNVDFVTDRGLVEYSRIEGMKMQDPLPKSILYRYPYEPCTCHMKGQSNAEPKEGCIGKSNINITNNVDHDDDDDDDDDDGGGGGGGGGGDGGGDSGSNDKTQKTNGAAQQIHRIKSFIKRLNDSRLFIDSPVIVRRSRYETELSSVISGIGNQPATNGTVMINIPDVAGSRQTNQDHSHESNGMHLQHQDIDTSMERNASDHVCPESRHPKRSLSSEPSCSNHFKHKTEGEAPNAKRMKMSHSSFASQSNGLENRNAENANCSKEIQKEEVIIVEENYEQHEEEEEEEQEQFYIIQADHVPLVSNNVSIVQLNPGQQKDCKVPLKHLSLHGFKGITDCTLDYLKNLTIDLLDLTDTCVTKHGIEKYLGYNPNCRVIHELYCVCKPKIKY